MYVTRTEYKFVEKCQECPYYAEDIDMGARITVCAKKGIIGLDLRNNYIDPRCPYLKEELNVQRHRNNVH